MTEKDLQSSIIFVNRIIASNNPRMAVSVLKRNGYSTPYDILSADQSEKALLELYVADAVKYSSAIKQISYRQDITNWTTSPEAKEQLKAIAGQFGADTRSARFDLASAWESIKDGIGTTITQMGGGSTTTTESIIPAWVLILIVIAGFAFILFILKKYGKTTA